MDRIYLIEGSMNAWTGGTHLLTDTSDGACRLEAHRHTEAAAQAGCLCTYSTLTETMQQAHALLPVR